MSKQTIYFLYPYIGKGDIWAFEVENFDPHDDLVRLPNGQNVMHNPKAYYQANLWSLYDMTEKSNTGRQGHIYSARLVLKSEDMLQVVHEPKDWTRVAPLINAAAGANALLTVRLAPVEYDRLSKGGWVKLCKKLSNQAQSAAQLCAWDENWDGEWPAVQVLRCGSCP